MSDAEAPSKFTLDDLLLLWEADPSKFKATLYCHFPQRLPTGGIVKTSTGETAGPITGLTTPVDMDFIMRELVTRNGPEPGDLVCRLQPAPGSSEKSRTAHIAITEGMIRRWGAFGSSPQAVTMPSTAPAAPVAPAPPPPTDLVSALTGMMMTMMTTLMKASTEKGPDPYVQLLMQENRALQEKLSAANSLPMKLEKSQWQEALEFGERLAGNNSGAMSLLAGPIDKLASGIEKGFGTKAEVEKARAEESAAKAEAEKVRLQLMLLEKQLDAARKGLVDMSAEDRALGEAALAEAAAAAAVEAAKNGTN